MLSLADPNFCELPIASLFLAYRIQLIKDRTREAR